MSTNGLIAASDLNTQWANIIKAFRRATGTAASAYGLGSVDGSWGAGSAVKAPKNSIFGSDYVDVILDTGAIVRDLGLALRPEKLLGELLRNTFRGYDNHAQRFAPHASVVSLETLLTYLNTDGGTWTALQDVWFREIYFYAFGRYPSNWNCYQEILQGTINATDPGLDHLYTNGMGKCVVTGAGTRTFTKAAVEGVLIDGGSAVGSIDSNKCAGGFGQLRITGITGTGVVTVTGIGFDPATRAVTTSKTWGTNVTGNGG